MKINWCDIHEQANRPNTLGCWIGYDLWEESGKREDPGCRLVPMRLIPDNEEPVDRDALVVALDEWGITFAGNESQVIIKTETRDVLRAAARAWLALDGETP